MNIWLPIITNLIILGILVAGAFIGKRNGFKVELAKLLVLLPACIGCYFLAPVLSNLILKISFISSLSALTYGFALINSIVLLLLFVISYLTIQLVITLIKKRHSHGVKLNKAKKVKLKGIDRKATRELRREERRTRKLNRPQLSKKSKVGGILLGIFTAVAAAFLFMLPMKYTFYVVAETTQNQEVKAGYDYTAFGQLDKITGIGDFISNK